MRAALYARFSTDKQSSIDDRLRVCRRIAEQHGLEVVATFEDAAISGGTSQRPGYQAMLSAARRKDIDVIVAEDASRIWRNMAEQAPRLAELRALRIHVVTHDLDTRQESAEWMSAILGTAAQAYRSEIARRTRRGLEGRALKAMPTGGKAYGYVTEDGKRIVVRDQASVVREIFERIANGESAHAVAIDLNARGVPSPGVAWNRNTRRRGGWHPSAISGDRTRGVGILNNDLYRGLVVWNRCRWVRLATDSKQRRVALNPEDQWVKHPDESLRIVSDELWGAVKRRQDAQRQRIGERVARGVAASRAGRTGRNSRYLLSGLLKCSECGSNLVMVDSRAYACSGYINGRICRNGRYVRRDKLETALLADVKAGLLDPAVLGEMERMIRQVARSQRKDDRSARIDKLETEIANIVSAIGQGMLSPALRQRLSDAETEVQRLKSVPKPAEVESLLPRLPAMIRAQVKELAKLAATEPVRARAALQQALQTDLITIRPAEAGRKVIAEYGLAPIQLATVTMPESVVAGVRN
jgi:DNA invertase Pin-like site-specific DNA recombinase